MPQRSVKIKIYFFLFRDRDGKFKTVKNQKFTSAFKGYKMVTLVRNKLKNKKNEANKLYDNSIKNPDEPFREMNGLLIN